MTWLGQGHPAPVTAYAAQPPSQRGRPMLVVVALGAAVLMGVALVGEVGEVGLLVGAALALIPVIPVTFAFLWLDRWEPEPPGALLGAFLWGAIVAAGIALVVNTLAGAYIATVLDPDSALAVTAVVVAPIVEETSKGAFLAVYLWRHRHEFDGLVNGVVMAGLCAAGFAFTENILYFGTAFTTGWEDTGIAGALSQSLATFVLRGVLSPFAHPLFTCMIGIGVGVAATTSRPGLRWLAPLLGLLVAVVLHGAWNAAAFTSGQAFISLYLTFMVPVFVLAAALAVWSRRREGALVSRHLPAYAAAGWLGGWEVPALASLIGRKALVTQAEAYGGPGLAGSTKQYHASVTELAFLRERMVHGTAGAQAPQRQLALLDEMARRRRVAYVPAPVA